MNIIKIKDITKIYGKKTKALDNVNLTIEPNKIHGLLGRNGAGKTTLLNIMTNKILPTNGDVTIGGETVIENDKVLSKILYIMVDSTFPWKIHKVFRRMSEFYPEFDIEYANSLVEKFEINISKDSKGMSTGEASIFRAIVALASNAEILLLDEPVLGVDPNHREMLYKEIIKNYSEKPKTIIISTHLIKEVATVIEEVTIIKNGEIIRNQSVDTLLASAYAISGRAEDVDEYLTNRKYTSIEVIGESKTVIVLEDVKDKDVKLASKLSIQIGDVELQKLCMSLTEN